MILAKREYEEATGEEWWFSNLTSSINVKFLISNNF